MKHLLLAVALFLAPALAFAQEEAPALLALNETTEADTEVADEPEPPPPTHRETAELAEEGAKDSVVTVVTDPECPEGKVCVSLEDMRIIMQVLRERKCLEETDPEFLLGELTIVVDEDGRIFYTGNGPESPYTLLMQWCHYRAIAKGSVEVVAALKEPSVWGFRLRPKAYMGYMLMTPFFDGNEFLDGVDAGLMLDFLHYRWLNLNAAVGFRTFGLGVGADITSNFGGYVGFGASWESLVNPQRQPLGNVVVGFAFAF
jgi:hypothetical protein